MDSVASPRPRVRPVYDAVLALEVFRLASNAQLHFFSNGQVILGPHGAFVGPAPLGFLIWLDHVCPLMHPQPQHFGSLPWRCVTPSFYLGKKV